MSVIDRRRSSRSRRAGGWGSAAVVAVSAALVGVAPSGLATAEGSSDITVYQYTGAAQTVVVPAGVHSVDIGAIGAGGGGIAGAIWGSVGALVNGNVRVEGGDRITFAVGGGGTAGTPTACTTPGAGGWSKVPTTSGLKDYSGGAGAKIPYECGAGGGGATVVMLNNAVVMVAGAGGGAASINVTGLDAGVDRGPGGHVGSTTGESADPAFGGGGGGGGKNGGSFAPTGGMSGGSYASVHVYQPQITKSSVHHQPGTGPNGSLYMKWHRDALPYTPLRADSSLEAAPWSFQNLNDDTTTSTTTSKGWSTNPIDHKTYDWWTYFDVDLGSVRVVHSVVLWPRTAAPGEPAGVAGANFPTAFRLEVSIDGNTWHLVGRGTAAPGTTTPVTLDLDRHYFGRYVRLVTEEVGPSPSNEPGVRRVQLAEFDVL
jgi:hypothetical protein